MEVFKYLKNIYEGENSLANHVSLFSLIGIMVLVLSCYGAAFGNFLIPSLFIAPAPNRYVLYSELCLGILIFIYLTGYSFNFCNFRFSGNELGLPDFKLRSFSTFLKSLPVVFAWLVYYIVAIFLCVYLLLNAEQFVVVYILSALLFCLIPFILLIFVDFSKDFQYKKQFFNPFAIAKYLDKYLGRILIYAVKVSILFTIVTALIFYIPVKFVKADYLKLAVWLLKFCIWIYFAYVFKYVYYNGCIGILRKNETNNN